MHDHGEILALAAAAIDFELDPAERSQLDAALEVCHLCRRQATAMRATATILRRPPDIGTPSRVREVVIGAALQGSRRTPGMRSLVAVSLSLLVVLGGTAVIAGSGGLDFLPRPSPLASAPIQTAAAQPSAAASPTPSEPPLQTAAPQASATAVPVPTATAQPSVTAAPAPSATPTTAPTAVQTAPAVSPSPGAVGTLAPGDIAAMVTDERLVIRTLPGTGADSAIFKTRIYPGQRVLILEGPVEASGYPWFRVQLGTIEGWVAAASREGEPWLAPVRNGLIAFVRDAADGSGEAIHAVGPDGTSGETVLLADPSLTHYEQLAWSPDGRRLAFVGTLANSANASSEIFVVDADGSNLVQITRNKVDDDSPAWSPDSTQIAFRQAGPSGSTPVASNVVLIRADGSGAKLLGPGANPVFSPDGLQLAMTVQAGGARHLWVQAADGADRRRLSEISIVDEPPSWSPDGLRLVFARSAADAGQACGLCIVEVSTGSTTPLTVEDAATPTWSIAGPIAFSNAGSAPGVSVGDEDGTGIRRVSGDLSGAIAARWSPDGRRLLFTIEGNQSRISIVDADGGGLTFVEGPTDVYVVASGDTLAQIARVHGLTVDELLAANPQITDPNRIAVGDEIRIPTIGATSRSPAWQPLLP